MRIRRRSIAGTPYSSSSSSSDKAVPLLGGEHGFAGSLRRPAHNWRNALLQAVQVGGEGDKWNFRCDETERTNPRDEYVLDTSPAGVKEGTSQSLGRKMLYFDREQELPKSGGSEKKPFMQNLDVGVGSVKKQRSKSHCTTKCHAISHFNAQREDVIKMSRNGTIQNNIPRKKDDNNVHSGSQCRRRNGRGWRCSERTLVGYHLCEHHLGKARLKSINSSSNCPLAVNNKGTKFKELHLIHAAAASSSKFALPS